MLGHSVIFQHVQQGCLSCIVQTQEKQLSRFFPKTYDKKEFKTLNSFLM